MGFSFSKTFLRDVNLLWNCHIVVFVLGLLIPIPILREGESYSPKCAMIKLFSPPHDSPSRHDAGNFSPRHLRHGSCDSGQAALAGLCSGMARLTFGIGSGNQDKENLSPHAQTCQFSSNVIHSNTLQMTLGLQCFIKNMETSKLAQPK